MAESIRGVRGVIDRTTVTPVSRSDADTRKDIQAALRLDPATESYRVTVSVQNAVATLTGSVRFLHGKGTSRTHCQGRKGNQGGPQRGCDQLPVETHRLANCGGHQGSSPMGHLGERRHDNVEVSGGKATLTGIVGSAIAKSRASDDAWVNGVLSVDASGMKVEPWRTMTRTED